MIKSLLQEMQGNLTGYHITKFTKYISLVDASISNKIMQTLPATFAQGSELGFVIFFD
ncbi:hypothetical protein [Sphingobacterium sp. UGAL515B_05]|jgi:hypothetical protein|uniref:hypothetical protein n=1 Tax=Sphingobacterium sp. UGAL515B_05 TaxID=2986767 RepID=UPI002954B1FD|nr:hypothetical protein [Sphingobacterium sp. UGAL515B_05]WON96465.1 hypothetical protein OK025_08655 [Sphingobacterium sp. UGAL515B_05]